MVISKLGQPQKFLFDVFRILFLYIYKLFKAVVIQAQKFKGKLIQVVKLPKIMLLHLYCRQYVLDRTGLACDYSRLWNKRSPWNNRSPPPPLKNFHITILLLFYINLGIAVIF